MVLIDALDETMEALNGNDTGLFLEERMLIKQLGNFLDINSIYKPLKNHLNSGINKDLLNDDLKRKYSDALWISLLEELYNIIPDKKLAEDYRDVFEQGKQSDENDRIASLQNANIYYFFEDAKIKGDEDIQVRLQSFEECLIKPGSFILDNPENNLMLDESIAVFEEQCILLNKTKSVK